MVKPAKSTTKEVSKATLKNTQIYILKKKKYNKETLLFNDFN